MKRFLPWLIPITVLLAAVPVLLIVQSATLAKIIGVIMVVVTSIALRFWLYNAGKLRKHSGRVLFTINERWFLESAWPYYKVMSKSGKAALEERAGLLLAGLSFDNYDHSEPSRDNCLAFSVLMASILPEGVFHHPENKVVVFRSGAAEIISQEKNTVLFIDESEVLSLLSADMDGKSIKMAPSKTLEKLGEFYAL